MNTEGKGAEAGRIEIPEKYRALFERLLKEYEAEHGPQTDARKEELVKNWLDVEKEKDLAEDKRIEHARRVNEAYEDGAQDRREQDELSGSTAGTRDLEDDE